MIKVDEFELKSAPIILENDVLGEGEVIAVLKSIYFVILGTFQCKAVAIKILKRELFEDKTSSQFKCYEK